MKQGTKIRVQCILAGLSAIAGVLMIGESFAINNGPPLTAPDSVFVSYALSHRLPVMWGSWLQAVGPALIITFALALVALSDGYRRVSGLMTIFGAGALMTTSLMEIACYIAQLYVSPPDMPRIASNFGYAIQHIYFFVAAPALFLPLGVLILGTRVLPRAFGMFAILLGAAFVALGLTHIGSIVLPSGVTAFAAVQALWWFAAGLALILRSGKVAGAQTAAA